MRTEFSQKVNASAEKVWKECLSDLTAWSTWDPNLKEVKCDEGHQCVDGATCVFVLKRDAFGNYNERLRVHFSGVVENSRLTYYGSFCCGLVRFEGEISLLGGGTNQTTIESTFSVGGCGCLGAIMGNVMKKEVAEFQKKSLENICSIAEGKGIVHEERKTVHDKF